MKGGLVFSQGSTPVKSKDASDCGSSTVGGNSTHVVREHLVLCQDTFYGAALNGILDRRVGLTGDEVPCKVRANAVADFPLAHVGANGDDLACRVRAWNDVLVCSACVLVSADEDVTVLI